MTSSAPLDETRAPLKSTPPPPSFPAKAQNGAANGASANGSSTNGGAGTPIPNFEQIASNAARFLEQSGKAISAFLKPLERGELPKSDMVDTLSAAAASVSKVAEHWMSDPTRMAEAQSALAIPFIQLWGQTYRRLTGEKVAPMIELPKDKRFAAPEWTEQPIFEFLRQAHAIISAWADQLVDQSKDLDPITRAKAKFYLRQITAAMSPVNFPATNPDVLRQTLETNGENLARGAQLLAEDMEAGHGKLRIRQTDTTKFQFGVNVATTPGKVVFRNDIIELIQYSPTTTEVLKRPLLIFPPWINKYYILDLNRDKSFVSWAVGQGITVFIVSWVNPDERHRDKSFESYMTEGVLAALDAIKDATGEWQVNAAGYCVGGTLLATTIAYMAATNDHRIASATFLTAQSDFTEAGELQVFIDEEQVRGLETQMAEKGYLESSSMATVFNMLRANDLLWTYVVENYMKGKPPAAFDLLFWNSDATRLPEANHSFYLRNFYIDNKLGKGELTFAGQPLDLGKIKIPCYFMAAKEDHIAPASSVFRGAKMFGGPVRYVLAGSGHIAGVINPPAKPKYQYWTGGRPFGSLAEWSAQAVETKGSWWPDWSSWLQAQDPEKVPARTPGDGKLPPLCDAPGEYVMVKS